MDKAQLCRHMVSHFRARARASGAPPLRHVDAREFLDELHRLCKRELADVGHFSISKVVKLAVETRAPRRGRDPVSGNTMVIPARRVVRARPARLLRRTVEGPVRCAPAEPQGG